MAKDNTFKHDPTDIFWHHGGSDAVDGKEPNRKSGWFRVRGPTFSDKPSPNGNYVERLKKCVGPNGLLFFAR